MNSTGHDDWLTYVGKGDAAELHDEREDGVVLCRKQRSDRKRADLGDDSHDDDDVEQREEEDLIEEVAVEELGRAAAEPGLDDRGREGGEEVGSGVARAVSGGGDAGMRRRN